MYIIVDEVWKPTLSYKGIAFISAELSIVLIPDFLPSSITKLQMLTKNREMASVR